MLAYSFDNMLGGKASIGGQKGVHNILILTGYLTCTLLDVNKSGDCLKQIIDKLSSLWE